MLHTVAILCVWDPEHFAQAIIRSALADEKSHKKAHLRGKLCLQFICSNIPYRSALSPTSACVQKARDELIGDCAIETTYFKVIKHAK